jgi:thiol:disulfide interchange protein
VKQGEAVDLRPAPTASSGRDLGALLALDWVVALLVLLFVGLAVSLWGGFSLGLPQAWVNRLNAAVAGHEDTLSVLNNG